MVVRRFVYKLIDSLLAIQIDDAWYVIEILAGQALIMYPNAMECNHHQIHAEIVGASVVAKAGSKHCSLVYDEVVKGEF